MKNIERNSIILLFSLLFFSIQFCFPISLMAASQGDQYEPDDSYAESQDIGNIVAFPFDNQEHTFHKFFDEDWIQFTTSGEGHTYFITAGARDSNVECDPIIELYSSDGTSLLKRENNSGPGGVESLTWTSPGPESSSFFIRFTNDSIHYGSSVIYDISIFPSQLDPLPGYLSGKVTSEGVGIKGAILEVGFGAGVSLSDGTYILALTPNPSDEFGTEFTINVHKDGYVSNSFSKIIQTDKSHKHDVELEPIADPNQSPNITGTPKSEIFANQLFSFRPSASDPENDNLLFSIVNKPAWLSFNPETGMLLGVPNVNHIGKHGPITITVQDSRGAIDQLAPFIIEVHDVVSLSGILMLLMK